MPFSDDWNRDELKGHNVSMRTIANACIACFFSLPTEYTGMGRNGTIDTVGRMRMSFMEYALRTKSRGANLAPGRTNKRFSIQIWHAAFFLYIHGYDFSIRSPMSSTRHQNHPSHRTPQAQIAVNLWTCNRITSQKKNISATNGDFRVHRIRLCLV